MQVSNGCKFWRSQKRLLPVSHVSAASTPPPTPSSTSSGCSASGSGALQASERAVSVFYIGDSVKFQDAATKHWKLGVIAGQDPDLPNYMIQTGTCQFESVNESDVHLRDV